MTPKLSSYFWQVPPRGSSSTLYNDANLVDWFNGSSAVRCLGTTTFLGLRFRQPWRLFYSSARPSEKASGDDRGKCRFLDWSFTRSDLLCLIRPDL
jgi:hypothetical protein